MANTANALLLVSLGLLVGVGALYNNLSNSGLLTNQVLTCAGSTPGNPICYGSVPSGCQSVPAQCTLSGTTISFLNACSSFTDLLTLNFIAFASSFFSTCGAQSTQSQVTSFPQTGNVTLPGLHATYGFHTNLQRQWSTTLVPHPTNQYITTPYYVTCLAYNGVASNAGVPPPVSTPCNFVDSSTPQLGFTMSCWLFGINTTDVDNAICNNWSVSQTGASGISNLIQGNILGFFMSLLGGILVLLLGLGINVGAATLQLGSNERGSKLAQTFGIGLLLWGPLYSEFSPWFTSGGLPNGLDGTIGVVSIVLTLAFFFGLWLRSESEL